ncbi:hypothetical protein LSM04_001535 [Trypanosoma melophagium]|uniref:uncharacterized protein n=1 Tax=Trypanosoma melophagium TaxID=715481 RepID=UPI00351A6ADB|nr:hypothetical protein LSM04_001535 [Trypanosoma melophagium]
MLQDQNNHNGRLCVSVHHGPITAVYTHHRMGNAVHAATKTPTATMIGGDAHAVVNMLRCYAPSDAVVCTADVKRIYNGVFTDVLCSTITRRDCKSEPIRYYRIIQTPHSIRVPAVEPREGLQIFNVVDN